MFHAYHSSLAFYLTITDAAFPRSTPRNSFNYVLCSILHQRRPPADRDIRSVCDDGAALHVGVIFVKVIDISEPSSGRASGQGAYFRRLPRLLPARHVAGATEAAGAGPLIKGGARQDGPGADARRALPNNRRTHADPQPLY